MTVISKCGLNCSDLSECLEKICCDVSRRCDGIIIYWLKP